MSASHTASSAAAATSTNAIPNLHGGADPATPMIAGIVCGSCVAFAWIVCFLYWWRQRVYERRLEAAIAAADCDTIEGTKEKATLPLSIGVTRAQAKARREQAKAQKNRRSMDATSHHKPATRRSTIAHDIPNPAPQENEKLSNGTRGELHTGRQQENAEDLYKRGLLKH